MKYIKLHQTDLIISSVALGTATLGAPGNIDSAEEILNTFAGQGGNLLDSALIYADWLPGEKGSSEKTIGRWMKKTGNRQNVILSTKGAHPRMESMHVSRLSAEEIRTDLETSLLNLQTDYIDIYFLHRDDRNRAVGEIMESLAAHVKAGKIRYFGLSNWSVPRIKEAIRYCRENNLPEPIVNQVQFAPAQVNRGNIDPTLEAMNREAFAYHAQSQMPVFGFSSQAKGYFSKLDRGTELSPGIMAEYENETNRKIYAKLKELSEKYESSIEEIVVAVMVSNPSFQTIPILGFSGKEQLLSSMEGIALELSGQDALEVLLQGIAEGDHIQHL